MTDELEYEFKFYDKVPNNNELITWEELYELNKDRILEQEKESLSVIREFVGRYKDYTYVYSTSMGKDSKLVGYLLDKASVKYEGIFCNTTLDSGNVYKEVKSMKNITIVNPQGRGKKGFYNLVKEFGVPSQLYRWCCSIFKEGLTEEYYKGKNNILIFLGVRNQESNKRKDYQYENRQWKNKTWIGCNVIRKWSEIEVWLYTIHNLIPINKEYKYGYKRVGCVVACPYTTKSSWILDKYWHKSLFNRWRGVLKNDFIRGEKWARMNCTEQEYYLNWNSDRMVRETPTEEVIKEFAEHKGIKDLELARKYFDKRCESCGKKVHSKNAVAMNLKMFGRNIDKFKCKKCLMKELNWTKEDWNNNVDKFQQEGCVLF